ncbi:hypothetical protein MTR67_006055, partial [Solanum verrucosum]
VTVEEVGEFDIRHSFRQANKMVDALVKEGVQLASCNLKNIFVAPPASMRCCCVYQKCPVKDDLIKLRSNEKCPVKDDLLDPKSNEECPVENDLLEFTSEELSQFTSQFSPENLIGVTDLGKLYHGKLPIAYDQCKVLSYYERNYRTRRHDDELPRLEDELKFLQAPKIRGNPNLIKVVGYCRKEIVGVVYDINPLDTLKRHAMNLFIQESIEEIQHPNYFFGFASSDDFNWLQRVKTALALARLLAYLHDRNQSYLIHNFAPSHLVVDQLFCVSSIQNFNPFLFEFDMLVGGVLDTTTVNETDMRIGPYGYIDPFYSYNGPAAYTVKFDVYAFGVLLFNLTSKRALDKEKYTESSVCNLPCRRKECPIKDDLLDLDSKKNCSVKNALSRMIFLNSHQTS